MEIPKEVKAFFDGDKLKQLPGKLGKKTICCEYLATKFEAGKEYDDLESKAVLAQWHTFNDPVTLRRLMIEFKLLDRSPDGTKYWKVEKKEEE